MPRGALRVALAALALGAAAAGCGAQETEVTVDSGAASTGSADRRALSTGLASEPAVDDRDNTDYRREGEGLIAAARETQRSVPLPSGGNFNGIQWDAVEDGMSRNEMRFVLQYNAACQWFRAVADEREVELAEDVIREIPRWSALRRNEAGLRAQAALDSYSEEAGSDFEVFVARCEDSARRERDYASQQGLDPPI